jgi:hypothetical protein
MDQKGDQGRYTSYLPSSLWRYGRSCPACHDLSEHVSILTTYSAIALAMRMRPVIWTASTVGVPAGGSAIEWDSQGKLRAVHPRRFY